MAVTLPTVILQPRLPPLFPNRYFRPGADVTTGLRETGEIVIGEVEFSNPKYAEKFRKAKGLK